MKELIIIEWEDAYGNDTYIDPKADLDDSMMTITVGWLVKETNHSIVIGMNWFTDKDDNRLKNWIVIPKPYIRKMRRKKSKELDELKDGYQDSGGVFKEKEVKDEKST